MTIRRPPEIEALEKIYKPYLDGCHLRDDAPQEAKDAFQKELDFYEKTRQEEIASWFD